MSQPSNRLSLHDTPPFGFKPSTVSVRHDDAGEADLEIPRSASSDVDAPCVWRDKRQLIVEYGAAVPPLCIKCAAPATHTVRLRVTKPSAAGTLVDIVSLFAPILVLLPWRSFLPWISEIITLGLCPVHQRRRVRRRMLIAVGAALFLIMFAVAVLQQQGRTLFLVSIAISIVICIATLFYWVCTQTAIVTGESKEAAEITGCRRPFLDLFPDRRIEGITHADQ